MDKVGIYVRISGDKKEDKDTSVPTQEEKGASFANSLGLPYIYYYDIGKSGTSIKERDDFNKFLKDIREGKIHHLYAINQSRIERDFDTWRLFVGTVLNAGAKWYPNGSFYELNNRTNRLMAEMMSLMNAHHAGITSDAVKIAFAKNAEKGKGHGQKAYGITYDDDGYMQLHTEEIKIVKQIFKWSLNGIGAYTIAKMLNADDNAPTRYETLDSQPGGRTDKNEGRRNKVWWGSTVSGILKNKLYMGIHEFGDLVVELPHLAILTRKEFESVQDNFKRNKKENSGRKAKNKYLLNNLLYCESCGYKFFGKRRYASRENTYKCSGTQAPLHVCKNSRGFNIAKVETFILKHLFATKDLQNHLNGLEADSDLIKRLELEIQQLQTKIKSTSKMVTKSFNLLYESDNPNLSSDQRIMDKYVSDKDKLKRQERQLHEIKKRKEDYEHGKAISRVNKTIDGFDLEMSFEAIKEAVTNLIERIDVEYIPLTKNGRFIFKIKYRGFDETIEFVSTQQLDRFALHRYDRPIDPSDYPVGSKLHSRITSQTNFMREHQPHSGFNEFFDKFGKNSNFHIRVKKDELIHFD